MPSGPSPQCRFRRASMPGGRAALNQLVESRRIGLERRASGGGCGVTVGVGRGFRSMRDAPFDAIPVGRGVSGMWGMRERPRLRRRAPIGASCMSRSRETAPGDHSTPSGAAVIRAASKPDPGTHRTLARQSWGGLGFERRASGGGCGVPAGGRRGRGACITRQSRAVAPAVPCYACHTCVVRHGLAGSARLSCYACPAKPRRAPTPRHPPSAARRFHSLGSQPVKGARPPGSGMADPASPNRPHGRRAKRDP